MDIFIHLHRISINMERRYFFAFNRHFLGTQRVHEITVVNAAGKQAQGQTRAAKYGMA